MPHTEPQKHCWGTSPNPLDEVVYIILSFQTDLARFRETWRSLRSAFPQWEDAERASVDEIAQVLQAGGLHHQKAKIIKRLLRAVRNGFGELSLAALRDLPDIDAERALTRLPGLSWKGARCVLLYSLQRDVFPVDGNTFRILRRTGVIPSSAVYRRRSLQDALQTAVPAGRRRPFHVNLVVHGQRTCLPATPRCSNCPALGNCQRRGLAALACATTGRGRLPNRGCSEEADCRKRQSYPVVAKAQRQHSVATAGRQYPTCGALHPWTDSHASALPSHCPCSSPVAPCGS